MLYSKHCAQFCRWCYSINMNDSSSILAKCFKLWCLFDDFSFSKINFDIWFEGHWALHQQCVEISSTGCEWLEKWSPFMSSFKWVFKKTLKRTILAICTPQRTLGLSTRETPINEITTSLQSLLSRSYYWSSANLEVGQARQSTIVRWLGLDDDGWLRLLPSWVDRGLWLC